MNIKLIKTKKDYEQALKRVESLWDAKPNSKESDELDVLATLIEKYENIRVLRKELKIPADSLIGNI